MRNEAFCLSIADVYGSGMAAVRAAEESGMDWEFRIVKTGEQYITMDPAGRFTVSEYNGSCANFAAIVLVPKKRKRIVFVESNIEPFEWFENSSGEMGRGYGHANYLHFTRREELI